MKFFSLLHHETVHSAKGDKVIPAEEFSTLMSAFELIEKAKEDVIAYKKEAEEQNEKLKAQAEKEGFEKGLSHFNEQLVNFEIELKKVRHEMNRLILPLALKAAKKIVAEEIKLHPDRIVDIVLQTLSPVTQNHRIKIYVNKADKEILEQEKPRIKEILEQVESLSILERSDIAPGGCIIETEAGIINASIENQWRSLESAFEKYMKH
jgi:type III secretion protein L